MKFETFSIIFSSSKMKFGTHCKLRYIERHNWRMFQGRVIAGCKGEVEGKGRRQSCQ